MTDIKKLRQEIDNIDGKLKDLFIRRLKVSEQVAQQKLTLNTPVYDKRREEEILSGLAGEEYANYLSGQFNLVMRNSRNIQYKSIAEQKNISYAANAQKEIKEEIVFIQGMPGSYSDIISEKK
jgi:chorismate mutase/prephenate dehydratase